MIQDNDDETEVGLGKQSNQDHDEHLLNESYIDKYIRSRHEDLFEQWYAKLRTLSKIT